MRRFFHKKTTQARPGAQAATNSTQHGLSTRLRSSSGSSSPNHGPAPTGRVRAPALRSRSMSVLNGPTLGTSPSRKFTRSLSFCAENPPRSANCCISRQLTKSEEDEVFQTYTRRVYGLFGALCAVVIAIAIYAYLYNYGKR